MDWKKLLATLCAVLGLACAPVAGQGAVLGADFTVATGRTVSVAGEDLGVGVDAVLSDSRCREGSRCLWAGDVVVAVSLAKPGGGAPERSELHSNRSFFQVADQAGYRVELVSVNTADTEVTLRVTKG